jgi:formylglycine-generating enzyme required for sulfatase activity
MLRAVAVVFLVLTFPAAAASRPPACDPDSVKVGDACIDKYEASVWQIPDPTGENKRLVANIQKGKVLLADLTNAGATQLGCPTAPFGHASYPANFPTDGNWTPLAGSSPPTPGVYAVSVAGVLPTACVTQFQAGQACALSGKHLIRNDEWQRAAAGTPDPGNLDDGVSTCVTNSAGPANTGSRSACVSNWGASDMVGNVAEWVAEWQDKATGSGANWSSVGVNGGDYSLFGGDASSSASNLPGAPVRGGAWNYTTGAGVFNVIVDVGPEYSFHLYGFRCAR